MRAIGDLDAALDVATARHPTATAIALVVLASLFFAAMHASVRHVSSGMHPFEIGFFRNLFGFLVFVPMIARSGPKLLFTRQAHWHLARGTLNGASMLCWFTALAVTPLADATALSLTGPLFVTLAAIVVLGETVRIHRWMALGAGAVGTLIIIRPGFEAVSTGAVLVLGSSVLVAGSKLIAKRLTRTDGTATIVAYLALTMTAVTFIPALFVWQWPSLGQLTWLAVIGTLGSCGHLMIIRVYTFADVSAVEPIVFVRLVLAALIGFLAFGELPDLWVWVGGGLIVASTSYIAHREAVVKRRVEAANEAARQAL